jgi:hypothetical protein
MALPFGIKLMGNNANVPLLHYLSKRYSHQKSYWAANPSCSREDVGPAPGLGTHPDVIEWLWKHMHERIPSSRCWVVLGTPVLVHPVSEVVFAFAGGTCYALRLPADVREVAVAAGAKQRIIGTSGAIGDLSAIGEEWVYGMFRKDHEEWWRRAFEHSAPAQAQQAACTLKS